MGTWQAAAARAAGRGVPGPNNLLRDDLIADQAPLTSSDLIHRADLSGGAASRAHSGS